MKEQMIVFAEILPIYKWLIGYYLFRKKEIYFIRLNRAAKAKRWVRDIIDKGRLKKIDSDFGLYSIDGSYDDLAFDNINIFSGAYKDDKVLKEIIKLYYNNNDFILALKKRLNQRLARFYYLNHLMHQIQSGHPGKEIFSFLLS